MNMELVMLLISLFLLSSNVNAQTINNEYIYDYDKLINIVKPIKVNEFGCSFLSRKNITYEIDINKKEQLLQSFKNKEDIDIKEYISFSVIYPLIYCEF
jgi:hypothetical protein